MALNLKGTEGEKTEAAPAAETPKIAQATYVCTAYPNLQVRIGTRRLKFEHGQLFVHDTLLEEDLDKLLASDSNMAGLVRKIDPVVAEKAAREYRERMNKLHPQAAKGAFSTAHAAMMHQMAGEAISPAAAREFEKEGLLLTEEGGASSK